MRRPKVIRTSATRAPRHAHIVEGETVGTGGESSDGLAAMDMANVIGRGADGGKANTGWPPGVTVGTPAVVRFDSTTRCRSLARTTAGVKTVAPRLASSDWGFRIR